MTIKLSELSETDRAELARLVAAQLPNGVTTTTPVIVPANENQTVDLTAIFNLAGITEDGKKQVQNWATKQAELVQQQVQMAQAQALAEVQRDNRFTELAQRLTGGTQEAPRGLKGVTADELKKHLKALPADEAKFFGDLLTGVVQNGLVEFSEIGHGKKLTGTVPLPAEFAEALDSGALKISDLSGALAGLGDLAQYDLSKWSK